MSDTDIKQTVLVPIDAITVVNPRARNQKVFEEIKANIAELWAQTADHSCGARN